MEFGIIIDKNGILYPNINDRRWILEKLKQNKEYKCKITNSRNIKHLGKYWLLMKALEFHFDNTDIGYHMFFKESFLEPIEFKLKNGKIKKYPNSIAFDKMDQVQFDEYYNRIEKWLNKKGYDVNELIETMEN